MTLWQGLLLLLKAVLAGLTYLQQKGAMDAGAAEEAQRVLSEGAARLAAATAARAAVLDDDASVYNDPDNRARKP